MLSCFLFLLLASPLILLAAEEVSFPSGELTLQGARFFQAANDYDLSPSRTLSAAMKDAGKPYENKI
jgi:hypothetical protein